MHRRVDLNARPRRYLAADLHRRQREAIAELERQQGRQFNDAQKAVFRARGEHRFSIPDGSRWGDVLAASTNLGEKLAQAMRAVSSANEELRGVLTDPTGGSGGMLVHSADPCARTATTPLRRSTSRRR